MDTIIRRNAEAGGKTFGLVLMLFSFIGSLIPYYFEWDMMQWGYGTITICIFLFIMGFVTYKMYAYRYAKLESLLSGKNVLAHWSYATNDYLKKIDKTFSDAREANKAMYKIVLFFFILFTTIFVLIGFGSGESDAMFLFVLIMAFCLLLISGAAYFAPILERNSSIRSVPEAIISKTGMLYLGKLHTWGTLLFILTDVELRKDNKALIFRIRYFTRIGWYKYEKYKVEVEIPEGKLEEARRVVKELQEKS